MGGGGRGDNKGGVGPEQHTFGVFDDHGHCGTLCSQFARDKVRTCVCGRSWRFG
jgi:hypothetical protein